MKTITNIFDMIYASYNISYIQTALNKGPTDFVMRWPVVDNSSTALGSCRSFKKTHSFRKLDQPVVQSGSSMPTSKSLEGAIEPERVRCKDERIYTHILEGVLASLSVGRPNHV